MTPEEEAAGKATADLGRWDDVAPQTSQIWTWEDRVGLAFAVAVGVLVFCVLLPFFTGRAP